MIEKKVLKISLTSPNVWQTPQEYIEAAREVLGDIDIDPCTTTLAQERIKAKVYYTRETNGLNKNWEGRLWFCPSYWCIHEFADKCLCEIENGNITEAIMLVPTTETWEKWFNSISMVSSAVCIVSGRIEWISEHGLQFRKHWGFLISEEQAKKFCNDQLSYSIHGNMVFYYGKNKDNFIKAFSKFGVCYEK